MGNYTDQVKRSLEGLTAVSTGICPGCSTCAEALGYDNVAALETAWENGEICGGSHFSKIPCGICNSPLGGNREVWHGVLDDEIEHFPGACEDCVLYLANGDEPTREKRQ